MEKRNEIFSSLIIECRSHLYRIAYGILNNSTDAEDAVSETTYKAFANFNKLRDIDKFKPWVMKILVNEAYSIANKRKRYLAIEEDIIVDNSDSEIIDAITLWDAVLTLEVEFRNVIILFYYEDLSINEISKILNIPTGTVNSRLNRSRQRLKNIFMKEGVEQYERF